jgi:hypothetical protein
MEDMDSILFSVGTQYKRLQKYLEFVVQVDQIFKVFINGLSLWPTCTKGNHTVDTLLVGDVLFTHQYNACKTTCRQEVQKVLVLLLE